MPRCWYLDGISLPDDGKETCQIIIDIITSNILSGCHHFIGSGSGHSDPGMEQAKPGGCHTVPHLRSRMFPHSLARDCQEAGWQSVRCEHRSQVSPPTG